MPDLSKLEDTIYKSCVESIVNAPGSDISKDEARQLLKNLQAIKRATYGEVGQTSASFQQIKDELPKILDKAVAKLRVDKLRNQAQLLQQKSTYSDRHIQIVGDDKKSAKEGVSSFMVELLGSYKEKSGGRDSTDNALEQATNGACSTLVKALQEHKLLEHFTRGIDEEKVVTELSELNKEHGQLGVTKNKVAQQVAQIIHNVMAKALASAETKALYTDELDGWAGTQTHDPTSIRRKGEKQWISEFQDKYKLDKFKTFGTLPPDKWNQFLSESFKDITIGRKQDESSDLDKEHNAIGSNLAKKQNQQRVIHFATIQDAYNYAKENGKLSFREQVVATLNGIARRTALADRWGVNAEANMERIRVDLWNKAREEGNDKTAALLEQGHGLLGTPKMAMNEVLGKNKVATQQGFWDVTTSSLMRLKTYAEMGMSAVSAQSDLINLAGFLAHTGGPNVITQWIKVASRYYFPGEDMSLLASQCDLATSVLRAQLINGRMGLPDAKGGLAKLDAFYFTANALHWHDQRITNVCATLMASHFGDLASTPFDKLSEPKKAFFNYYNIKEREWDIMRQQAFKGLGGKTYLTPSMASQVPYELVKTLDSYTGRLQEMRSIQEAKDDLHNKFSAMFTDAAAQTVPRASSREKMILYQGTMPNTGLGRILRMMGQFKTFPITMITKLLMRSIHGNSTGLLSTAVSLGMLFGLYEIYGAAITGLKATLLGKTMALPTSTKGAESFAIKATTAGGGTGYLGDALLPSDTGDNTGASIASSVMGPVVGDAWKGSVLGYQALVAAAKAEQNTKKQNLEARKTLAKGAVNLASGYVPFSNHFATKYLFNYGLKYAIMDSIDPHYTDAMEKRMKDNDGTRFILPPSINAKK